MEIRDKVRLLGTWFVQVNSLNFLIMHLHCSHVRSPESEQEGGMQRNTAFGSERKDRLVWPFRKKQSGEHVSDKLFLNILPEM